MASPAALCGAGSCRSVVMPPSSGDRVFLSIQGEARPKSGRSYGHAQIGRSIH
jgi:hypothetical protein